MTMYRLRQREFIVGLIAAGVALIANAVWAEPLRTGITFGVVLGGAPVYLMFFRR